jgi:alkaline phosphatase D
MAVEHAHPDDGRPIAVEVVTPSVTSQNLDEKLGRRPHSGDGSRVAADMAAALPGWRWCELESHGYTVVDVDHRRAAVEWWFVDTVLERRGGERLGHHIVVPAEDPRVSTVAGRRCELLPTSAA